MWLVWFVFKEHYIVGPRVGDEIQSLIQSRSLTFVACGSYVKCFKRGRPYWTVCDEEAKVLLMLLVGVCLATVNSNNTLKIWDTTSRGVCVCVLIGRHY